MRSSGEHAYARKWHLTAAEFGGAWAVFHGIGFWSPPAAWIVGGIAAIVAVEVRAK